jgi:hypothetical protein
VVHDHSIPVHHRPSDLDQNEFVSEQGVRRIGYRYLLRLIVQRAEGGIDLCALMIPPTSTIGCCSG